MKEIIVKGETYRVSRIPVMKLFLVAKRLMPVIAALIESASASEAVAFEQLSGEDKQRKFQSFVVPVAKAIAGMSDEDSVLIVGTCLGSVTRKRAGDTGFAPVWSDAAQQPMFDDMDLSHILTLTGQVLVDQVGPFIQDGGLSFAP